MADAKTARKKKTSRGFSAEEKSAMRQRVREVQSGGKTDEEGAVLEKIAAMSPKDRAAAERIHRIVRTTAPQLAPRLWYGMPAYAKDGKLICHFQDAKKFKTRYPTLGFSDKANLDDGSMWPVAYAVTELTPAVEARIAALVKQAAS